jgi:hypothetical protein
MLRLEKELISSIPGIFIAEDGAKVKKFYPEANTDGFVGTKFFSGGLY